MLCNVECDILCKIVANAVDVVSEGLTKGHMDPCAHVLTLPFHVAYVHSGGMPTDLTDLMPELGFPFVVQQHMLFLNTVDAHNCLL